MTFDAIHDRTGTHSLKWDSMEERYGVSPETGLAMWVADMDFRSPDPVSAAVRAMADHGIYGYFGEDGAYREAIRWWMETRHGWALDPAHVFSTSGLVNAVALCLDTFTAPGDGICLMTPVYHAFHRIVAAAGREVVEMRMPVEDGLYRLDIPAWDAQMTGRETMLILCSPHNPGGRVWTRAELEEIAAFARRHDLLLISDEIHHDLVYPGHRHIPMALIDGIADRLIMLTAASKTFNIAGVHIGNVTIADDALRRRFAARLNALGLDPNSFGLQMVPAAYSPEGAAWVDELVAYVDGNRQIFDAALNALPGVASMPLQSTYLAWVDFAGTGMTTDELERRVAREARIAANKGDTFGSGGGTFLRFNLGMPRAQIEDACARLTRAFADLQ
jgi:cystathionine beta-lyase